MQNLEWYLADLKSTGKNTIETVEKYLTDMFITLVRIYPCLFPSAIYATPFVNVAFEDHRVVVHGRSRRVGRSCSSF